MDRTTFDSRDDLEDYLLGDMRRYIASANGIDEASDQQARIEANVTRGWTVRTTELARACTPFDHLTSDP